MADYMAGPAGVGTVATTSTLDVVTGTDTLFLTQYQEGDTLVLYYLGVYYSRIIKTITSNTSMTVTVAWNVSASAAPHWGLRDAETLLGSIPRSEPDRARVQSLSGREIQVGYGRSTWILGSLTTAQWYTARLLLTGADDYSGPCLIKTRRDVIAGGVDAYGVYKAVVTFPHVPTVNRWGAQYQNVALEFILVELITVT